MKETHAREGAVHPLNGPATVAASRILSHARTQVHAHPVDFTRFFARTKTSAWQNGTHVKINVSAPIGKFGDPGTIIAMRRKQTAG